MNHNYEYIKQELNATQGFIKNLPITIDSIELGYVSATMTVSDDIKNPFGSVHGGCIYSVADTVAGIAAMTHGKYVTTTSGSIHYFNAITSDSPIRIETKELKRGKSLLFYDVFFYSAEKELLCKASLEFFALSVIKNESLNPNN